MFSFYNTLSVWLSDILMSQETCLRSKCQMLVFKIFKVFGKESTIENGQLWGSLFSCWLGAVQRDLRRSTESWNTTLSTMKKCWSSIVNFTISSIISSVLLLSGGNFSRCLFSGSNNLLSSAYKHHACCSNIFIFLCMMWSVLSNLWRWGFQHSQFRTIKKTSWLFYSFHGKLSHNYFDTYHLPKHCCRPCILFLGSGIPRWLWPLLAG